MDFSTLHRVLSAAVPVVAPAIVCRVEQAGNLVFEQGYGWQNPMLKTRPVTASTMFDLASLTKLFTVTACLRLCDAGLLTPSTPLVECLPDFAGTRPIGAVEDPITKAPAPALPDWRNAPPVDASTVTLYHLMTHTAGLPAWRNIHDECGPAPARPSTLHKAEIQRRQSAARRALTAYAFAYPPGQSYLYSDVGLILLGMAIAERCGDVTLGDTLQKWVLDPLQLTACYNPPGVAADRIVPTEFCAWRQRRLHGEVHDENAAGLGGIAGHAGLFATARDVCRLGRVYLLEGDHFLASQTVRTSLTEQVAVKEAGEPLADGGRLSGRINGHHQNLAPIRRGLGWMLNGSTEPSFGVGYSPRSFGHTGFTGTSLWCDPDRDLAVALLTNRVYNGRGEIGQPQPIARLRVETHAAVIEALEPP